MYNNYTFEIEILIKVFSLVILPKNGLMISPHFKGLTKASLVT